MLGTLIRKEIAETVLDFRFVVATVLCLGLIPLGMYVSRKDYERRLADYQQQHQTYRQHYGTPKAPVTGWEEAQGFRPPSILSIFASGLDPFVPDKVITSYQGLFRTTKETGIDNPQSLLFGKADWLFNIIFIMSLVALIFTYNTISGEKETGTLRLMIANAVPRRRVLLSKILGKYAALLIPLVLSILITLFVLDTSPVISITSPQIWPAFLLILAATLLFLLDMVSLGVCISTFTQQSMGSIVLLFLVWTMFVLGVPKVCPILAEVIYPIPGDTSISFAKRMAQEDIERKYKEVKKQTIDSKWEAESNAMWQEAERRGKEIGARQAAGREPTREDAKELNRFVNETNRALEAKYTPLVDRLVKECGTSVAAELNRIEQDYRNKRNTQRSIAMNLCRISPISCYAYVVSGLSGTGVTEPDNCLRNAQRFQDQMKEVFYNQVSWGLGRQKYAEGFNPWKPPTFPDMVYHYPSLAEALHVHWPDMFLLAVFGMLFCALAFLRFNKYDVR
jgi:ABC-type transport system involved in multi-copper enzyme maturation permease subunit